VPPTVIDHLRPTTFAAAVGCIDGRIHPALNRYVAERHGVDAVDLVTEPGVDGALASGDEETLAGVLRRLDPSCDAHACRVIVIAGHEDCAAMPGDLDTHRRAVARATERLRSAVDDRFLVEGVVVHLDGNVEVV
jgi:carbonic anhydrase